MQGRRYYYSTRDLLMMAALAALGGVSSTYINALGDLVQSVFGFAGTTQWASGLHVLWLVLAAGLTRKQGAGTLTGILKGCVELLSGNTHGLLVLLVDIAAGMILDLVLLAFRQRERRLPYALAGGLASASNVFIFQLFAALPADLLTYAGLSLVAGVAFLSGVAFGGLLGYGLINALRAAGVVKEQPIVPMLRWVYWVMTASVILLSTLLGLHVRSSMQGAARVEIQGAVAQPFAFPSDGQNWLTQAGEGSLNQVSRRFEGVPLNQILAFAEPAADAEMVMIQASDGYAFFVAMQEVEQNSNLMLVAQGKGEERSYAVMGAENSKAWVHGVTQMVVLGRSQLQIEGALDQAKAFDPSDWQYSMDSVQVSLEQGSAKLQGVPLGMVLASQQPQDSAREVILMNASQEITLDLVEVLEDEDLRIFSHFDPQGVRFIAARMNGEVLLEDLTRIQIQ